MCCRAVRLWRGFAGCGRLPQHPLWCGEFRLRINAGFRPPCSLRERQSRKRGLLSAGALCRGGRAGRFYHDTKRRSHPPAVRYYHFIAALFSITAEKCKDFFCLFPDFRKAGIWGRTGAGRRKAQGGSGERCLWESGAMLRCSGGMEGAVLRRNVRHGEPGRYRGAQGKSNERAGENGQLQRQHPFCLLCEGVCPCAGYSVLAVF